MPNSCDQKKHANEGTCPLHRRPQPGRGGGKCIVAETCPGRRREGGGGGGAPRTTSVSRWGRGAPLFRTHATASKRTRETERRPHCSLRIALLVAHSAGRPGPASGAPYCSVWRLGRTACQARVETMRGVPGRRAWLRAKADVKEVLRARMRVRIYMARRRLENACAKAKGTGGLPKRAPLQLKSALPWLTSLEPTPRCPSR